MRDRGGTAANAARALVPERPTDPDRLAAFAGIALGLALLPMRLVSNQIHVLTLPPLLLVASVLYLVTVQQPVRREHGLDGYYAADVARLSAAGVLVGTGLLGVVAVATGGRTVAFFALAGVVGAGILAQILLLEERALRPGLVLGQVLLFALVVRFAALLTTPGLVGVDAWTHVTDYAASVQAAGSLAPLSDVKYGNAPLYHVLVVVVADAVGTSLRTATFLSIGVLATVATTFVYGAGNLFLPQRWALFAVALYSMADHVVRWGIHLIPTSLGLVFFLGALYAITRLFYADARGRNYLLALAFALGTVLTHQVSAFVLLVVLGAGVLGQLVQRARGRVDPATVPNFPALFAVHGVAVAVSWTTTSYNDGTFLGVVTTTFQRSIASSFGFLNLASEQGGGGGAEVGTGVPTYVAFVDVVGFLLLLFAVTVGALAMLRRDSPTEPMTTYFAATLVTAFVTLGLPLFGLRTFLPGRWYAFMYAPMVVLATIGCWFAASRLPRSAVVAGLVVFAALFPAGMLVAHKGTPDAPVFDEQFTRFAYTESELGAVETVGETRPAGAGALYTDHPYRTVFTRTGAHRANVMAIGNGTVTHDAVVYRRYQSEGAPVLRLGEDAVTTRLSPEQVCGDRDRVYANDEVAVCTTGAGV